MDVSADAVSLLPESVKITSTEPSPSKSAGPSAAADLIPLQTRLCHESLFGTFESVRRIPLFLVRAPPPTFEVFLA